MAPGPGDGYKRGFPMATLKPFLVERMVQPKIWGGRQLRDLYGIGEDLDEPIGESWELFDRPEGSSPLRGGGTLRELMAADPAGLLGRGVAPGHGDRFPLLLKFLDAEQPLSVQVHPDDRQAVAHGDGGKTEAWIVLRAGAGARIVRGFRPGVTREQFVAAARAAAVEDLLHSFAPRVGDCVAVPAGTVHAIKGSLTIFEVQQNSDTTFRLYDWGRGRELHVERAIEVARVEDGSLAPVARPRPLPDGGTLLLETPYFRLRRYALEQRVTLTTGGRFAVATAIRGQGVVGWHSGGDDPPLRLRPGDSVLVPAVVPGVFVSPIGGLELVVTDPGER